MPRAGRWQYGVSTLWMPGVSLNDAIALVRDAGFRVFELVPGGFDGVVGWPAVNSPGLWPRCAGDSARQQLKEQLSVFEQVIVHAGHLDLNIASDNPGIRAESVRQYLETADLAIAIGATRVTFHPGFASRTNSNPEEVVHRCVEFARLALDRIGQHKLLAGYENVGAVPGAAMGGIGRDQFAHVLNEVNHPLFGLHFDLGWAVKTAALRPGQDPIEVAVRPWLDDFAGRIVSVHLHGVLATTPFGLLHHAPVHLDNVLDYVRVLDLLAEAAPDCPIVFEPLARHAREAVEMALRDLQFLRNLG